MTPTTAPLIFEALAQTWPAFAQFDLPPFILRNGAGGGKRVSAATANGPVQAADLPAAEHAMGVMGQPSLFMLRDADDPLDEVLAQQGYRVVDPTVIRACPIEALTAHQLPRVSAFTIWEPLHIMREIWAEGGIGPARVNVMERVTGAKTALLARSNGKPSGTGFVAVHGDIAMVHALETRAQARRQGAARHMMIAAAQWAQAQGARHMAVAVTQANVAANTLYNSLNMPICAKYHYRIED